MRQPYRHRMNDVVTFVGRPPRGFFSAFRRKARSKRPPWLKREDLIWRIYESQKQVLRDGEIRWAAVVQANSNLFHPGASTCPSQVIYSPDDSVPLPDLLKIARECFALKGTTPADPGLGRIAHMLTDEMERALDWPIPHALTGGRKVVTTAVMIARDHVPGGFLGMGYFPIVADPATSLAALVPCSFWPEDLWDEWRENTHKVPIAVLTEAAARELRRRAGGATPVLEVHCIPQPHGKMRILFKTVPSGTRCVDHRTSRGVLIQFPDNFSVLQSMGMIIDFRGGTFTSNKAIPQPN